MDLKQIKELMTAMEKAGIKKLTFKDKAGFEIHLERQEEHPQPVHPQVTYAYPHTFPHPPPHIKEDAVRHAPPASTSGVQKHPIGTESPPAQEKQGKYVSAPLVGTFYNAPSPDDPPFVKVGDRIEENTVICIIEAMKVMNEVKAGLSGVLEEILVENAHPVEFGTKMFRIV